MKIYLDQEVFNKIMAFAAFTRDEFSGFGFCEVDKEADGIFVYDFEPLDIGNYVFTKISPEKILPLMSREDARNLKVWVHRHPMGNGIPGRHNWSGTDEDTITQEPLGSPPHFVLWSVSIVLTPKGLVGRIDKYKDGKVITKHLEVTPNIDSYHPTFAALEGERTKRLRAAEDERKILELADSMFDDFMDDLPEEYWDMDYAEAKGIIEHQAKDLVNFQPELMTEGAAHGSHQTHRDIRRQQTEHQSSWLRWYWSNRGDHAG
ncbi:MAG: hypothetical protein KQI81_08710 [Deltaproteobacteria bacterium]|nr:hypothetical protein [Deltaproteobacteria bacterium]